MEEQKSMYATSMELDAMDPSSTSSSGFSSRMTSKPDTPVPDQRGHLEADLEANLEEVRRQQQQQPQQQRQRPQEQNQQQQIASQKKPRQSTSARPNTAATGATAATDPTIATRDAAAEAVMLQLQRSVTAQSQPDQGGGGGGGGGGGASSDAASGANGATLERVPTYLQPNMPVRERLHHFTFAWYTVTMSTSGIALVLGITPHRFPGLNIIGLVIFLLDLLIFVGITFALVYRFSAHRHTFGHALMHPSESLFIPTFFLSICALLSNASEYSHLFWPDEDATARRGLARFLDVMFWIYLAVTFSFSAFQYHLLFSLKPERRLQINAMTPAWILPIFPVMLAGTLAAAIAPDQKPYRAMALLAAGLAAQGLGFLVSVFMYATYLSRLMVFGLPAQRPGMFIAVGPPSFTCAAFIGISEDLPRILQDGASQVGSSLAVMLWGTDQVPTAAVDFAVLNASIRFVAIGSAVFLWGLSFWFFATSVAGVVAGLQDRKFHLSWWSFVFPNAGLTIATIRLGVAFDSEGVMWFSSAMAIVLVVFWLFIGFRCIFAVLHREIVWPGHDEDS